MIVIADSGEDAVRQETTRKHPRDRIIVALDVNNEHDAQTLVRSLCDEVSIFKVGLELFTSVGPGIIHAIHDCGGEVFLDCKYMDIPATVAGASRAAARLGVKFFDVHCFGGRSMITSAVKAAHMGDPSRRPRVLGVTVLTSLDERMLSEDLKISNGMCEQVVHLANLGVEAGLDGVIASPLEVAALRKSLPATSLIVTPGVRPTWASGNDQKRVATPYDAIRDGADFIVIGRPVTQPPKEIGSPQKAIRLIINELATA